MRLKELSYSKKVGLPDYSSKGLNLVSIRYETSSTIASAGLFRCQALDRDG